MVEYHTVRNLHFLSKNSTLISREKLSKNLGEKLVKMLGFCQNWISGQKFDFSNSVNIDSRLEDEGGFFIAKVHLLSLFTTSKKTLLFACQVAFQVEKIGCCIVLLVVQGVPASFGPLLKPIFVHFWPFFVHFGPFFVAIFD